MRRCLLGRLELRVKCSARSILLVDIVGRYCRSILSVETVRKSAKATFSRPSLRNGRGSSRPAQQQGVGNKDRYRQAGKGWSTLLSVRCVKGTVVVVDVLCERCCRNWVGGYVPYTSSSVRSEVMPTS